MSPFAGGLAGGADHLILNTGPFCLISWPGLLYPGDNGLSSIVLTLQHGMWPFRSFRASLVAQMVKNSPATWKTWVNPWAGKTLEEGMATHSSILAWRIPMDRGTWQAWCCKKLDNWATKYTWPEPPSVSPPQLKSPLSAAWITIIAWQPPVLVWPEKSWLEPMVLLQW